jgi:diguanylate cyclase (GGDEF)-like protein
VLREIAQTLLASLRSYDMCVRFAGDEFVIVLGDCPPDAAEPKRQELQQRVEEISLPVEAAVLRVGVSAGAAVYPHDGRTYEALLATADRRMYTDKALRRRFRKSLGTVPADWESGPPTAVTHRSPVAPARPN